MDKNAKLPEGTWAVSKEDKAKIRTLGRKLLGVISEEIMKDKNFQVKTIYGAFDYVSEVLNQKRKLVNENMHIVETSVEQYGLLGKIEEPMADEPEPAPATPEQVEAANAVAEATPAPSAGPVVSEGDGSIPSPFTPEAGPEPVS